MMEWLKKLWRKRMKIEKLLVTDKDAVGDFVTVEDAIDLTVQIASTDKAKKFSGNVLIEGTLDQDPKTDKWSPLLTTAGEEVLSLSGYALAGLRASTFGMAGGEVTILASYR